jgi:hypothetical protein
MQPDPQALDRSLRALSLWRELAALYDEIETRLDEGEWPGLDRLAGRLADLESRLAPFVAAAKAARADDADPALKRLQHETDELIGDLAQRQPRLVEAAVAARNAAASHLARVRVGRTHTESYNGSSTLQPRFTSRRI